MQDERSPASTFPIIANVPHIPRKGWGQWEPGYRGGKGRETSVFYSEVVLALSLFASLVSPLVSIATAGSKQPLSLYLAWIYMINKGSKVAAGFRETRKCTMSSLPCPSSPPPPTLLGFVGAGGVIHSGSFPSITGTKQVVLFSGISPDTTQPYYN